jgi:hypothetical protein
MEVAHFPARVAGAKEIPGPLIVIQEVSCPIVSSQSFHNNVAFKKPVFHNRSPVTLVSEGKDYKVG